MPAARARTHCTGGAGNDVFYFSAATPKSTGGPAPTSSPSAPRRKNTIADFAASAANEIAFSNAGFALGQSGASATPKALPTSLFTSDATGAFTAATAALRLRLRRQWRPLLLVPPAPTAGEHLVATLTNHPALAASHLFFIT